jgi:hypothetical protein
VQLRPIIKEKSVGAEKCAGIFERYCTVCSSVKKGIEICVSVDWQVAKEGAEKEQNK